MLLLRSSPANGLIRWIDNDDGGLFGGEPLGLIAPRPPLSGHYRRLRRRQLERAAMQRH